MKRKGVTYELLVDRLAEIGVDEKEVNVRNKLSRGQILGSVLTSMSQRDRKRNSPPWPVQASVAFSIVAVIGLVALLSYAKFYHYNSERQYKAISHPAAKGVCLKLPPLISFCPEQEGAADADAKRSDDDLYAQQEMADWAFVVALASLVGLVLSAAGIGLVYATFRKTADAVEAARQANEISVSSFRRQLRAYLTVDHVIITRFDVGQTIKIETRISNVGASSARGFWASVRTAVCENPETFKVSLQDFGSGSVREIAQGRFSDLPLSSTAVLSQEALMAFNSKTLYLLVYGVAHYRDVFGKRHFVIWRGYVHQTPEGGYAINVCRKNNYAN